MNREEKLRIIRDDSIRVIELRKGDDLMTTRVTDDGRYRADIVGSVSSMNHGNADSFLKEIARTLGGIFKVGRQGHGHHHHEHGHGHHHHN